MINVYIIYIYIVYTVWESFCTASCEDCGMYEELIWESLGRSRLHNWLLGCAKCRVSCAVVSVDSKRRFEFPSSKRQKRRRVRKNGKNCKFKFVNLSSSLRYRSFASLGFKALSLTSPSLSSLIPQVSRAPMISSIQRTSHKHWLLRCSWSWCDPPASF